MRLGPAVGNGQPGRGEKVLPPREVRCDSAEQRGQSSRARSGRSNVPEEGRRGGGVGHGGGPRLEKEQTEAGVTYAETTRTPSRGGHFIPGHGELLQVLEDGSDLAWPGLGGGQKEALTAAR